MPLQKIQLKPGVDREGTTYSNEGGYYACDKVRFRSGFPEQIGGWTRMNNNVFLGTARALINWITLAFENYVGVGTNLKYYIEKGGTYYDITPIRVTTVLVNPLTTGYSTLDGGIAAADLSLTLVAGTSFAPSGVIKIGTEEIYYALKSGNVLSSLTRGYNSTTAASHSTAAAVGSSTVIVTDSTSSQADGDFVTFSGSAAIGGIAAATINQEYQVILPVSGVYAVQTTEFATSQVTGGGGATVTADYQIHIGLATYTLGVGWGAGTWGRGTWGSATTIGVGQQLTLWSHDNFGEDLLLAPRGGAIYYWDASVGLATRAKLLSDLSTAAGYAGTFVPTKTNQVMASGVSRFTIALGANSYDPTSASTAFDPMFVRWSAQENPYEWVPAITNQAGEQRLSQGSTIMHGEVGRQEILIWTDSSLYSMQYIGPPYVFGFNMLSDNTSIISPNATATVNNVSYWMGVDKFYTYTGRVDTLPCTLRQYIFSDINRDQAYQVVAGTNEGYNEIWWFYCSAASTTIDRYVIYNHLEQIWAYGTMSRTAWLDSSLRPFPMGVDENSRVVYHETSANNESGDDPVALSSYIESSDFDIGDGHNMAFVWRIIPDVNFTNSDPPVGLPPQVLLSLIPRRFSGSPYTTADAPTVTRTATIPVEEYTGQVYTRIRGRQMKMRIESNRLGTRWQLGSTRVDTRPDGRR